MFRFSTQPEPLWFACARYRQGKRMSLPRLPSDLRAVIADLGGTMVDTLGDFVGVRNTVVTELTLLPAGRALVEHTGGKGCENFNPRTPI